MAIDNAEHFNDLNYYGLRPFMGSDLYRLICGEKLGFGQFRTVYDCSLIKGAVIKIAENNAANITEASTWFAVMNTPAYRKWFAPVLHISPCGHFLIQKKCRLIKEGEKLPKNLPQFFTDVKKDNFGWIGKQLVCFDYQFLTRHIDYSMAASRKIDWK